MKTITIVFAIFIAVLLNGCFIIPSADDGKKEDNYTVDENTMVQDESQTKDESSFVPDNYEPPRDEENYQDNQNSNDESVWVDENQYFSDQDNLITDDVAYHDEDDFFEDDERDEANTEDSDLKTDFEEFDFDDYVQPDPDNFIPDEDVVVEPTYIPNGICNHLRGGRICHALPPSDWTHMLVWWDIIYDDRFGNFDTILETANYEVHFFDAAGNNEQVVIPTFDTYVKLYNLSQCFAGTDDGVRVDNVFSNSGGKISMSILNAWKDYIPHYWTFRFQMARTGNFKWYVTVKMRSLSQPIWVMTGADFWRNNTSEWAGVDVNNTEAGRSDWIKIGSEWTTVKFGTDGTFTQVCY